MHIHVIARNLGAASLVLLLSAAPVLAGNSFFLGISPSVGDFGKVTKSGFHGGGCQAWTVAPMIEIGVRGTYHQWGVEEDGDDNVNSFELLGYGRISAPGGYFGTVGIGFASSGGLGFDGRDTDPALAFGGGYGIALLELTALYHIVKVEGDSLDFLSFSAGIRF